LGGNLTIYDLITLNSGSLLISETGENYELKLLGDFQSGGGILEGTNGSNLSIEGTNEGNINLIFSNTNNTLNTLSINRPSSIIDFSSDLIIEENLDLSDGKIRFNNSILSLAENSIVSNFSENSYIITGENGIVKKVINANEDFEFPIGTNLYYAPVNITPQNTETFTIRVTDNILQNGYTGSPITDQRIVNLTWNIEHPNNTIVFDSNFSWEIGAERSDFNQSLSYLATYNTLNNKWVKITESNTDVNSINNLFAPEIKVQGLFSISSIFNTPPSAEDQEFTIQEHSLNETVVGNLVASDSDVGQILTFYLQENTINPDAFIFHEDGTISVKNSDLLEYSLHPTFNYTVDVCDNGEPEIECSNFDVTINLTEVTQNFLVTNYISPNGDGKNDTWVIKGLEKETYSVAILDGKGNIIFRSDDYKNTWDGTKFGNKLAPGVYYYSITSKNVSQKGTITLIR
jgi:gliding motility-associated-like protein